MSLQRQASNNQIRPKKLSQLQNTQLNLLTVTSTFHLKVNRDKLSLINRWWKCKIGKRLTITATSFRKIDQHNDLPGGWENSACSRNQSDCRICWIQPAHKLRKKKEFHHKSTLCWNEANFESSKNLWISKQNRPVLIIILSKFQLGSEAWGNETKEITLRIMDE